MDEEAPPSESELRPLWQMARVDCTNNYDNQQNEILAPVGNATSTTDSNPPEQQVSHLFFITGTVLFLRHHVSLILL
jgi:hypothetical protein